MTDFGMKAKVGKNGIATYGFLAGKDSQRVENLHWAFDNKEIAGVWCLRGGYGLSWISGMRGS